MKIYRTPNSELQTTPEKNTSSITKTIVFFLAGLTAMYFVSAKLARVIAGLLEFQFPYLDTMIIYRVEIIIVFGLELLIFLLLNRVKKIYNGIAIIMIALIMSLYWIFGLYSLPIGIVGVAPFPFLYYEVWVVLTFFGAAILSWLINLGLPKGIKE